MAEFELIKNKEPKRFHSLNRQIQHLETKKAIIFKDKAKAKRILLNTNYYNLIACSKVKFAMKITNGRYVYLEADFEEWLDYYRLDCEVSEYLMKNILRIERKLNSRISYCISLLIEYGNLTPHQLNTLKQTISHSREGKSYIGKETWRYIPQMTFGEMKKILMWLQLNKPQFYKKVTVGYDFLQTNNSQTNKVRINELNNLRNDLFHFRPLSLYLTYGKGQSQVSQHQLRKKIINCVLSEHYNPNIKKGLQEIFSCSDNFIKIKNSQ